MNCRSGLPDPQIVNSSVSLETCIRAQGDPLQRQRLDRGFSVKVPRIGPPRNMLEPVMRKLKDSLGVETAEDGLVAFLEFDEALADIVN